MPYAGELGVAPYHQVNKNTSTTPTFTTTDTTTDSITVNLINGLTYAINFSGNFQSSVGGDDVNFNLKEDNSTGNGLDGSYLRCLSTGQIYRATLYAEYVAVATAAKTFVVTGKRQAGTGNISRYGAAGAPSYLIVDRVL